MSPRPAPVPTSLAVTRCSVSTGSSSARRTARARQLSAGGGWVGGRGALYTGHALVYRGGIETEVVATTVTFDPPTAEELDAYVATRESIGAAGAFTLEGRSSAFIPSIGGDASNVLGLSVAALRRLLARFGVPISALWR